MPRLHVITGAFGYTGKHIARRLLDRGERVETITRSPDRENPFGDRVRVHTYDFEHPDRMAESLRGADGLYNTYWVRFNHRDFTFAEAVANSKMLFQAARGAGVGRIVHVSITNPSADSELEYFSGKAEVEAALAACGVPHSILRPAVIFGGEDILINNIAWALRHLPVFGVFGDGNYRLQPIHVEDMAELAIREGEASGNRIIEAIGPETFTYRELARTLAEIIGAPRPIISVPPALGYAMGWALGKIVGDVMITRDEIRGLMQDKLHVNAPPAGATKLTDWARENRETLGRRYASELGRRRDRRRDYSSL